MTAEQTQSIARKAAIANARLVYQEFKRIFGTPRFETLKHAGAHVQRPLWASTSTKNPAYRDVLYAEELIGPDTVDTMPLETIENFRDHGRVRYSIEDDITGAHTNFENWRKLASTMTRSHSNCWTRAYRNLLTLSTSCSRASIARKML